ncbi:MAG: hypothetical protein AAFO84_04630, partial [Cyanobacteria bacterium J06598_1]
MVWLPESIKTRIKTASAQLAPRRFNSRYATGLALTLTVAIAGCATSPDQVVVEPSPSPAPEAVEQPKEATPPTVTEVPAKDQPTTAQPNNPSGQGKQPGGSSEMVTVSVYTIDDDCDTFVAQPIQVASGAAMNEAVGKAVSETDLNAFKLDGYQVNISGGTAVVDMQLAAGSERQFVS